MKRKKNVTDPLTAANRASYHNGGPRWLLTWS